MGRWLAVDYGTKRVGLAVTDPMKIIATALETVHSKDVLDFLKEYDQKETVDVFVVGMPATLQNADSENAQHVKGFIKKMKKIFPDKEIVTEDERFTSSMAQDAMIRGGMKKKNRRKKENVDKISAVLILQSYMEKQNI